MTDQEQRNLAIVKKAYVAITGDQKRWEDFYLDFSDDAELHEADSLPYGGVYRTRAGIIRGAEIVFSTFDKFSFDIVNFLAGGDSVIAHLHLVGVGRKTGKSFAMPVMELWRFKNDKVAELRLFYYDTARIVEVFGS